MEESILKDKKSERWRWKRKHEVKKECEEKQNSNKKR